MAMERAGQTVRGQVEAVNPKGIKRGAEVELSLDASGFIRGVMIAGSASAAAPASTSPSAKDVMIVRQTALKAAAEFAASRPEAKSADVLKLAQRWAAWVLEGSATEEAGS